MTRDHTAETTEYTDGSRLQQAAAASTTRIAEYLGLHATVIDAELLGIGLALGQGYSKIALDSQSAITRASQLFYTPARSWVELRIQKACKTGYTLMWVKGHSDVQGNVEADRRANLRAYGGRVMACPDVMTPAGVRHDFRVHTKPKHLRWSRKAVRGLTFIVTDRGPLRRWLKVIGRRPEDKCDCGEIQNAVHVR